MDSNVQWLIDTLTNGESIENFTPKSRLEEYLKAALTRSGTDGLDIPRNRLDALMYQLPEQTQKFYEQGMADSPAHAEKAQIQAAYISVLDRTATEIVFPEGITKIGRRAFQECKKVTEVTLPESITFLEGFAFSDCTSLTKITLSDNLTWCNMYAFSGTAIEEITLPSKLLSGFTEGLFRNCKSLRKITCNAKMKGGLSTFALCSALETIIFNKGWTLSTNNLSFTDSPLLTVETMVHMLETVDDNTGGTQYTLRFGSTNLAKLTEEQKLIAYNKNIALA